MAKIVRDKKKKVEAAASEAVEPVVEQEAEEAVEEAEEAAEAEVEKKPKKKAEKKPDKEQAASKSGGNSIVYRIIAFVLWALAIGCEVFAIMILLNAMYVKNKMLWLIILIVADLILAIIAAQLWKKANHINPPSKKNKFTFYLWSELGVIMAAICFLPLIILLLKDKDLDKKTKTIVTVIAVVAFLITGVASADFDPISSEEKQAAENLITQDVYWTTWGRKYHLDLDCQAIKNSDVVTEGTVTEAIESGKTSLCKFCARNHDIDTTEIKVEDE
ncbi:MAG: hypothetical protein IJM62_08320 [Lachnospiraceae bacterium]|nr:hypothetical protein [Lachnospiraceae bacterium]